MNARVDIVIDVFGELFSIDDEDEVEEEDFADDMEMEFVTVPASESAIGKLEMLKNEDEATLCVVCLEQILLGSQATRMPCAHVFHGDCILKWLSMSRFCPLCRL
ncbi:E3 ubiquitin-protein ligase SIRP1-like [Mangifera indica]|uniref:E3 ubiquitin-protein ligase SIRP1-like n=1 Tax=Mangifera indica TaxID=29780 RepID=UPI001CFB1CB4|nr:E3 ubiquitin-protein ligase SIRP1-like [Mangifera indica]